MSYYGHDNRVVEIYVTALQLSEDYSILLTNMLIYFMLNTNLAYIRILNSFDIYLSYPKKFKSSPECQDSPNTVSNAS